MIHPDRPFVGPGSDRRLSAQPARSRQSNHADRQGGRSDRPVELMADRHAPEGRRLHRRRVRQGRRRHPDRRQPGQLDLRQDGHRRGVRRRCPRPGRTEADRGLQRLRAGMGPLLPQERGPLLDQPADPHWLRDRASRRRHSRPARGSHRHPGSTWRRRSS